MVQAPTKRGVVRTRIVRRVHEAVSAATTAAWPRVPIEPWRRAPPAETGLQDRARAAQDASPTAMRVANPAQPR